MDEWNAMYTNDGVLRQYCAAAEQDPAKYAEFDGLLKQKAVLISQLHEQVHEVHQALKSEKRKVESNEARSNEQIEVVGLKINKVKLKKKLLKKSNKEFEEENARLVRSLSEGVALNEFDQQLSKQHEALKGDNKELFSKIEVLRTVNLETQTELNELKEKTRDAEPSVSVADEGKMTLLEERIVQLENDKDNLEMEVDIARQDKKNREPECWRDVREAVLNQKNREITELKDRVEFLEHIFGIPEEQQEGEPGPSGQEKSDSDSEDETF